MLFDLRARGRRTTIKVIYVFLALLMGGGLVFFGIGGATNGGLLDAFKDNGGGTSAEKIAQKKVTSAQKVATLRPQEATSKRRAHPQRTRAAPAGWAAAPAQPAPPPAPARPRRWNESIRPAM